VEKLLNLLLVERDKVAHSALKNPADRSAFEYGRVSGQYHGLTIAIEALTSVLADKDEDE